jgi:putative ATP-binding cassette transporter
MFGMSNNLWKRFWKIAKPYWFSNEQWQARGLLLLLIILLLGQTEFNVLFIKQTGEFTSALAAKDADRFWHSIKFTLIILVIAVPIYAFYYYVRDKLAVLWRQWITHNYLNRYFSNRAYYALESNADVDNPDQRISEDIDTFTQRSLYFFLILLGEMMQLIAFSTVLWSISRALVYFLVVYAFAGTLITLIFFGKSMITLNFNQLKREADFRFSMVRIRENAESIALYRGEIQESTHVKKRFHELFVNYTKLIKWQRNLNFFQYAYSFLTIILPSAIIASKVLSGELEVGSAVAAAGAFSAVLSALNLIMENFEGLSRFIAGINRLDTFSHTLTRIEANTARQKQKSKHAIHVLETTQIALANFTLMTPDNKRTLISNLTLEVNPGDSLLIVGASGEGKSSLLRAIAGLWTCGNGSISRPGPDEILFLPQHSYMILGNLRSQLLYPNNDSNISDEELYQLLDQVKLPNLANQFGGLNANLNWGKVLSVGEQQRLAFARVLLAKPRYVMLDEATSALDIENEKFLYQLLANTASTMVSISHRPTLLDYHQQVLELSGSGNWQLHTASTYRFKT